MSSIGIPISFVINVSTQVVNEQAQAAVNEYMTSIRPKLDAQIQQMVKMICDSELQGLVDAEIESVTRSHVEFYVRQNDVKKAVKKALVDAVKKAAEGK